MKSRQFAFTLENVTRYRKWRRQGVYPEGFYWGEHGYDHGVTILARHLNPMVAHNRLYQAIDYLGIILCTSLNEMRIK